LTAIIILDSFGHLEKNQKGGNYES
jgi:hypothetical protein